MDNMFYANVKVNGKPPMKINKSSMPGLYNVEFMANKTIIKKENIDSETVMNYISIYIWEK